MYLIRNLQQLHPEVRKALLVDLQTTTTALGVFVLDTEIIVVFVAADATIQQRLAETFFVECHQSLAPGDLDTSSQNLQRRLHEAINAIDSVVVPNGLKHTHAVEEAARAVTSLTDIVSRLHTCTRTIEQVKNVLTQIL